MPDMTETNHQIDGLGENAINADFAVDSDFIDTKAFGNRLVVLRSGELCLRLVNDRGSFLAGVSMTGQSWWDVDLALKAAEVPPTNKPLDSADSVQLLCESPNHLTLIQAWSEDPHFEKKMSLEVPESPMESFEKNRRERGQT